MLKKESRRWQRLPLSIPVFVRGTDQSGQEFLEFTALLNISGGGALVAMRRVPSSDGRLDIEIPLPPAPGIEKAQPRAQRIRGRVVHASQWESHGLMGLEFSRPLLKPMAEELRKARAKRSAASPRPAN